MAVHPNRYIDSLLWGTTRWDPSSGTATVNYFFGPAGVDLSQRSVLVNNGATGVSVDWLVHEQDAYRSALQSWANVANIQFAEVFAYGEADLIAHRGAPTNFLSDAVGIHEAPAHAAGADGKAWGLFDLGSDARLLQPGGDSYITLVHEIGHGLGLAHPHDRGGGSSVFPGVRPRHDEALGDFDLNQGIFTTMSYNVGWKTDIGPPRSPNFGAQAGPMAFDIAAIQHLYGPNTTFASGDDQYLLGSIDGSNALTCIWDTGGTDSITYSGRFGCIVDLHAATLRREDGGGGFVSYVAGAPPRSLDHWNAFTIAKGVVIENASGGSGRDLLVGNDANNTLLGNGGHDDLYGASGADSLSGGPGRDILLGNLGSDNLEGGRGGDIFAYNALAESKRGSSRDLINDFTRGQHDRIDLSPIDADTSANPGNDEFTFIGGQTFHGGGGEVRFAGGIVRADINGDRIADLEIKVAGIAKLVATDFIL